MPVDTEAPGSASPETLPSGTLLELDTPSGPRHLQVLYRRPPYPEVVRLIRPSAEGGHDPEAIARQDTARIAMIEVGAHLQNRRLRSLGIAPIPADVRSDQGFRVLIRDRSGDGVYSWLWNWEGLQVADTQDVAGLPLREILSLDQVERILDDLKA